MTAWSYVGLRQCIPRLFHAKTTYFPVDVPPPPGLVVEFEHEQTKSVATAAAIHAKCFKMVPPFHNRPEKEVSESVARSYHEDP